MRLVAGIILLISVPSFLFAQDSLSVSEDESVSERDSIVYNYNRVMVIPLNPDLYFSDSDQDLAEYNRLTAPEIRRRFRYGLDFNVHARILSKYETKDMLRDTSQEAQRDLQAVYKGIGYEYRSPSRIKEDKRSGGFLKKLEEKVKPKDADGSESAQQSTQYYFDEEETKYMHAVVHNPEMLTYLNEKYGTELFLFINQFELKTNYEKCLDRANKIFQREVKIHFTLYDKNAKMIYGDVVTVIFPSNTNSLDQIIRNNFPLVANYISDNLPASRKKKVTIKEETVDE